ncbi:MAG: hypothetical protein IJN04_00115 [Clostridia bacterium]|nr:hypothetical protein [Clostridia bacterium]
MAQNGMFRNAFRGFNKQDVLQYIDDITAGWAEERTALEQKANDAVEAQEQAQAAAAEAQEQAQAAVQAQQEAQEQAAEMQDKLTNAVNDLAVAATTIEEMAHQLEEAQRRTAQLEQELAATANERDAAIAALADAKEQLTDADAARRQLEDCRRQNDRQNEQIASMQQTLRRYESVLGDADAMQDKIGGLVRPCIRQTAAAADSALENTQHLLTGMINQLDEIQRRLTDMRGDVQQSSADSDARLSAILDQWLSAAQGGSDSGFFQ